MSPVNKQTIHEKLFRLQEYTKILEAIRAEGRDLFFSDYKTRDSATLNMFAGIEMIVDIGNHIITEAFQKRAKTYVEVITILGETGVIPATFAGENEAMPKFRNLVAHDYGKITPEEVYQYLQKAPEVFRAFARAYVEFLDKIK